MTLLQEATEQKKYDSRLVERSIQRNTLRQEELDQFVKNLPDDAENATFVNLDALMEDVRAGKKD